MIEVGEGGGYFDPARVLWDERADGPLPAITLGGMKRVGKNLVFDAAILAAQPVDVPVPDKRAVLGAAIDAAAADAAVPGKLKAVLIALKAVV